MQSVRTARSGSIGQLSHNAPSTQRRGAQCRTPWTTATNTLMSRRRDSLRIDAVENPQSTTGRTLEATLQASTLPGAEEAREAAAKQAALLRARAQRKQQRERQQLGYRAAAIAASALFFGLAFLATYYRFFYLHGDAVFPWVELWSTVAMIGGGVVVMEMYARWAHRVLWHEFEPGWKVHKSHHEPRVGAFEDNDIFAVANALPAIALTAYGFFTPTQVGGLCFGFGMGITVFGILYMFIHDGLVHKRFPVGPIAELPQLKRIAIAHRLHHSEKYGGVPFGMFLGPQELEAVGAGAELDRLVEEMKLADTKVKVEANKVRQ